MIQSSYVDRANEVAIGSEARIGANTGLNKIAEKSSEEMSEI